MLEPVNNLENVFYVDLENSDLDEVVKSLGLGLLNDEMENVRTYFSKEGRKPTDVELQAIDQAWSEHCCYKSSKPVLEETVFGLKSSKKVVAREDAGIMEFDDEHYYAVGLEINPNHVGILEYQGELYIETNRLEMAEKNFSGMIKALSYGAPPHGGMAPGIDRIVMLLANKQNIREVTLFPMNQNAQDLMMNAPSKVNENQLKELNLISKLRK